MTDNIFWEIHSELPREGAGNNESTDKAFSMLAGLPKIPHILDVACGPGMQTLELAKLSGGKITALDNHQPFLDELKKRADKIGIDEKITTVCGSMFDLPFEPASFDLIWSEGAVYIMGFREALTSWKTFLKDPGHIAISELCWLKDDAPNELKNFWKEYPDMNTVQNRVEIIASTGYKAIGHFTLPQSAWWDDYYTPMEKRLASLRMKYRDNEIALKTIAESQHEIDLYRKYSDFYGYVFFIMQKAA